MPKEAAVRARLLKVDAPCLLKTCGTNLPNIRPPDGLPLARRPKQSLVKMLMQHHERLAKVFTSDAPATAPAPQPLPAALPPPPLLLLPSPATAPPSIMHRTWAGHGVACRSRRRRLLVEDVHYSKNTADACWTGKEEGACWTPLTRGNAERPGRLIQTVCPGESWLRESPRAFESLHPRPVYASRPRTLHVSLRASAESRLTGARYHRRISDVTDGFGARIASRQRRLSPSQCLPPRRRAQSALSRPGPRPGRG